MSSILPVYKKLKIDVDRAEGAYIWDKSGKKYTDFLSGVSVTNLGHRPPVVIKAIEKVLSKYIHLSNLFPEKYQEELAHELAERAMPGKVFFSNSGAEANECAIKMARKYFGGEKYEVISFKNSFHGRTIATLAATGQRKFSEGFGPIPEEFHHAEFNFLASAEDKINDKTCAIIVEVVQGEGGINIAKDDFILGLRKLCDDSEILLIFDEIQTGMGRTGKFLGSKYYKVKPDIVTLGKALGGGLPLAATLIRNEVAAHMKAGDHGSTFGGNPVSCAAGLATVRSMDESLMAEVMKKSKILFTGLKDMKNKYPDKVKDIRGLGLMVGMELTSKGEAMIDYLLENGYVVNCTQEKVIRFLPPLTIGVEEINKIIIRIEEFFKERT